ncbi:helix-turn-helix transcriptional regulator [Nonomuraea rubra]|uniref:helix-turn-helix transcriptional regulator n=1 Tax=Nonomuraea rubra TaxID=46180 RepID=UPI0031ED224E
MLREWRHRRELSQLDLAIQADVSARHVSFVETGRTIPSRSMVIHLAEHLGVPLRERNRLLVARPGDAPAYAAAWQGLERPRPRGGARGALGAGAARAHEPVPSTRWPWTTAGTPCCSHELGDRRSSWTGSTRRCWSRGHLMRRPAPGAVVRAAAGSE